MYLFGSCFSTTVWSLALLLFAAELRGIIALALLANPLVVDAEDLVRREIVLGCLVTLDLAGLALLAMFAFELEGALVLEGIVTALQGILLATLGLIIGWVAGNLGTDRSSESD